ncbi:MAG: 2-dehydropantoate 2-reductase [Synergistaceae bacterium]|nr:2-dehydropantoate 2-reductase [Synergistaceae bacterium]
MKRIETAALVGLGAIGAAYLSRISERIVPENIRVIADSERAERISAGVAVNGRVYRFPVYGPEEKSLPPSDLAIFAVKWPQLGLAIEDMKNQIGPETIILSLLNGITSEREIIRAYGDRNVLLSLAMGIDATRNGGGTVYTSLGFIQFGEARNDPRAYSPNVIAVKEFFDRAGIEYEIPADMRHALWKKFMMNAGANQTTAVLGCAYGLIQTSPDARRVMRAAMEEVASVAEREGVSLTEEDIDDGFARLDRLSPSGLTSMSQDISSRRTTEADMFGGTVTELAGRHGLASPVNETLFRLIKAIEASWSDRE